MKVLFLPIPYQHQGREDVLYPVLLQHQEENILVDCGYDHTFPQLEDALAKVGIAVSQLTGIVLTHHDIDHMAGAYPIKERFPAIPVYASAIEAKYISGAEKSLRLQQAEDLYACLPEEQRPAARQFQEFLQTVKPIPVDYLLAEISNWPMAGNVDVVFTPGHTPGHISLYIKEQKTLVAADAMVIENGRLNLANPQFALDLPRAIASVHTLQTLAVEKLICYHGGLLEQNVPEAIADLSARLQSKNFVSIL